MSMSTLLQSIYATIIPTIISDEGITPLPPGIPDPLTWLLTEGKDVVTLPNGVLTTDRATTATYIDNGIVKTAPANTLRHEMVDGRMMALIEGESTNLFLNSGAPVTQDITTTAQAYTISVRGAGDATASGSGSGTATQGSPLTIIATAGTLTVTPSGILEHVQVEALSFQTSYIPTASAPVVRAADLVSFDAPGNMPRVAPNTPMSIFLKFKSNGGTGQIWKHEGVSENRVFAGLTNLNYYRSSSQVAVPYVIGDTLTYAITVDSSDLVKAYHNGTLGSQGVRIPDTDSQGTIVNLFLSLFHHASDFMVFDSALTAQQIEDLHIYTGGTLGGIMRLVREVQPVAGNEEFKGADRGELGIVLTMTSGSATLQRKGLNEAWVDVENGAFSASSEFWVRCNGSTDFRLVLTGDAVAGIER